MIEASRAMRPMARTFAGVATKRDNVVMVPSASMLRVLAPAKVNLHLRVGPARADGYHPLWSWMCTIGLFDTLEIVPRREGGITLSTNRPDLPTDLGNLVIRAAEALAGMSAQPRRDLAIALHKRIPVGAGLGGGSSDAAHALMALNRLWHTGLSAEQLAHLSAGLGSDLPFFFHGPSAICGGRGERVYPIPAPTAQWALLILPPWGLSTAQVYRQFDQLQPGQNASDALFAEDAHDGEKSAELPPAVSGWRDWTGLASEQLLPHLRNDLEPAAFAISPELGRLRDELEQALGRIVRMSGSGSSLFTLYDDENQARDAAGKVRQRQDLQAEVAKLAPRFIDDLNAPSIGG